MLESQMIRIEFWTAFWACSILAIVTQGYGKIVWGTAAVVWFYRWWRVLKR